MLTVTPLRKASASAPIPRPSDNNVVALSPKPPAPPRWLVEWRMEEPLEVTAAEADAALQGADAAAMPAEPELVGVVLEQTLELYGMPKNWPAIAKFYVEALLDVPPDLVVLACRRLRLSPLRFFPKPGEIREHIVEELQERKRMLYRAQLARRRRRDPQPPHDPVTVAEREAVDALLQGAIAVISSPAPADRAAASAEAVTIKAKFRSLLQAVSAWAGTALRDEQRWAAWEIIAAAEKAGTREAMTPELRGEFDRLVALSQETIA